ncbi:hypothetical protein FACS189411_13140 [Bacteroidia bacterium]|nr:hypothetical protein FACS189411_13140 [Bacteroidia bacterium]
MAFIVALWGTIWSGFGNLWPTSGSYRVLRGGGWRYDAGGCRVSHRDYFASGYRIDFIGFRLVLPL